MDYEIIRFIWWILVGVLLIGFVVMDGHDMGVGILSLLIGKTDTERRIAINSVAPHWDGNQVWFITGGGAIFAAWPFIYAAAFSGFYIAMLAVLWTIFLRPVAFEYRSKINNSTWRTIWDIMLFIGSFVSPVVFGVAFGNLLQGVPFKITPDMQTYYEGTFFALLNPFALLCGILSLAMVIFHGGNYLIIRTEGALQQRAKFAAIICGCFVIVLFAIGGYIMLTMNGYVANNLDHFAPSNPLLKSVEIIQGGWLMNYTKYPFTIAAPVLGFIGAILAIIFGFKTKGLLAFICSAISIIGIIMTVGCAMFPFLMPSSIDPKSSLTMWDCTSSEYTLNLMFVAVIIFIPFVLFYTSWAYKVMRGKITHNTIENNSKNMY